MTMRIRGQASLSGGTTPLYVVDGMPIVGDISTINPDEIESLKRTDWRSIPLTSIPKRWVKARIGMTYYSVPPLSRITVCRTATETGSLNHPP